MKSIIHRAYDRVILEQLPIAMSSPDNIIHLVSLTHNQMSAKVFNGLTRYAWFAGGYVGKHPEIVKTLHEAREHLFRVNDEMIITFDYGTMDTNPFDFLLVPLRSACGQNMSGGIILGILCGNEFHRLNQIVTQQCFIKSQTIAHQQFVFHVLLSNSSGTNVSTEILLSTKHRHVINSSDEYQNNRSYSCYYKVPYLRSGEVHFGSPSKTRAIAFLSSCIILIFISNFMCCFSCCCFVYYRSKSRHENNIGVLDNTSEIIQTSSSRSFNSRRDRQEDLFSYEQNLPPPSYDDAIQGTSLKHLRRNVDNVFNRWPLGRQMPNAV
ncbi:unnamed protein product [Adineta ricciae]|uniref:Uncharacterized protein n=1 Tax=Adineta ricciae TaxID=249248 RepID=A0A815LBG3_ADIRI|nr:unnamed protein product [Adineta ricciae]CAF1404738.1 unnamed protein product [Adineta ricciae]